MEKRDCRRGDSRARMIVPPFGSVYYQPGRGNSGIPNFTESIQFGIGIDANGDGEPDMQIQDYSSNGRQQDAHLFGEMDTVKAMAYGEYTFDGAMNITPFFHALYAKRETFQNRASPQFFPEVPANNPFNPCNPDGVNGVDCGLAWDSLMRNPTSSGRWSRPPVKHRKKMLACAARCLYSVSRVTVTIPIRTCIRLALPPVCGAICPG